ncbi:hypothetical protein MRB53_040671 [Persea americana]|nr:hypothetical protein MRB53_040671 [Persea americana]
MVDSELPIYGLDIPEVWRSWTWSHRYPGFKELRKYFDHVANVLDLRKDCRFNMRVTNAHWSDTDKNWKVTAGPEGNQTTVTAQHVIFCLVRSRKKTSSKETRTDIILVRVLPRN